MSRRNKTVASSDVGGEGEGLSVCVWGAPRGENKKGKREKEVPLQSKMRPDLL